MMNTYSLRPHAYAIYPPRSVDSIMRDRMIARNIIPLLEFFPEQPLLGEGVDIDVDRMMSRPEVLSLPNIAVDKLEKCLDTILELTAIDWVVLPRQSHNDIFFAKVDSYKYIRYQAHMHVKHYVTITDSQFSLLIDDIPVNIVEAIKNAEHLDKLPNEIYDYIQTHKPAEKPVGIPVIVDCLPIEEQIEYENDTQADTNQYEHLADDQIISPRSFSAISRQLDDIAHYQKLHISKELLHNYLMTHMLTINRSKGDDCDVLFTGIWHDNTEVLVKAYELTDECRHSAWLIAIKMNTNTSKVEIRNGL